MTKLRSTAQYTLFRENDKAANPAVVDNKTQTETSTILPFSFYRAPIANTTPLNNTTLLKITDIIRSDRYKNITAALRDITEEKAKREFKEEHFDYVTFSCTTLKRDSKYVRKRSGLFCVDIDHFGDAQAINELKVKIISLFAPVFMFRSPSGDGLKVIYHIDINHGEHLEYYFALESFFVQEFDLEIDKHCKDVVRACFLCFDSEAYYNESPDVLDRSFIDTFQPQQSGVIPVESVVKLQQITAETITDPTEIIERVKTWLNKKETFIKGNRNNYITMFAGALNRYGIPETTALNVLKSYQENDFPMTGIKATVRSIYSKTELHGVAKFDINTPCTFADVMYKKEPKEKQPETPLLPIEGMPEFIQDFIDEYLRVYNLPRDYIAGSVIISSALGIGDKLKLVTNYHNNPIFWMSFIGNVASGKTHPLQECLKFFTQKDSENIKNFQVKTAIYEAEINKPKNERDKNIQKHQ